VVSSQRKASTEPDDGKSIDRAKSRVNAVLLSCASRMPETEPMICYPSTRKTKGQPALTPGVKAVKCHQPDFMHRLCLVPLLLLLAAGALTLQDLLSVLVELELGDDDLGWGEGDGDGLAVGLLADDCVTCEYLIWRGAKRTYCR
jgi:hypothetical protein